MKNVKISVAVVAVLALGTVGSSAAFAELEFNSSVMGNLAVSALQTQTITTSAGTIECTTLKATSGVSPLHAKDAHVTVSPGGCTAFGLSATSSAWLQLFLIDGLVHISQVTITAGFGLCTVTIPAQLWIYKYTNVGSRVEFEPTVTNLKSRGEGVCEYAEEAKGTYSGKSLVEVPGGTFEA